MPIPRWFEALVPTGHPVSDVRRFLREAERVDTLRHVSRVAGAGRRLGRRFGVPLAQSDLACTAHDLAAVIPLCEIIPAAEMLGVALSVADRAIPQIVHGPVAAMVLRERLGVGDEDVLNAVRHHTTLRAGAAPLEMLAFIADKIAFDPTTRDASFHPALVAAMKSNASLPELCGLYLDWAVCEGPRLGWRLHPNLVAAHDALRKDRI
ncbi:MAG: HD domain-containing protein [Anaerolineales bacterium]